MEALPCGHIARQGQSRLCGHLVGEEVAVAHYRLFRGRDVEFDLICPSCEQQVCEGDDVELIRVCAGCVERIADETWDLLGWRGKPGIRERPELWRIVEIGPLAGPNPSSARAVAPYEAGWITLSGSRQLWCVRGDEASDVADVDFELERPRDVGRSPTAAVHSSPDGAFAAVVNDYGSTGVLMDLARGAMTMRLDRGPYHPEQTPFPAAFVRRSSGEIVVFAATSWNRVDAFDPRDGRELTPRVSPVHAPGHDRPAHYLAYFHGALRPSPDGRWLFDDGWVWHPVGVPTVWSIDRWLDEDVWESEDGPSIVRFPHRDYLWDAPMCWVGDRLVAIWGFGFDADAMVDGVMVYDVGGTLVTEFAGVAKGRSWSDGNRLYVAGEGSKGAGGLSVWDPVTGERTSTFPDLDVIAFHPWLSEFLVRRPAGWHRVRLVLEDGRSESADDAGRRRSAV